MLSKLIDYVKEKFYTPQIGDRYYFHFTDDPWDNDRRKKEPFIITEIRDGYIRYIGEIYIGRDKLYYSTKPIDTFKRTYTRIK